MEYSQLQKDFKEKDIQRLRNLVTEKYGEKTVTQVGHQKDYVEHVEGDVWEENDKTWTIKNGLKQTYTKLDAIKKAIRMPIACPKCKKAMKHAYDDLAYNLHTECFDCVIKRETLMRFNGTFQQYSDEMYINNMISFVNEAAEFINDYATESDDVYYTEEGVKEIFTGGKIKDSKVEAWKKELAEMKQRLSEQKVKI